MAARGDEAARAAEQHFKRWVNCQREKMTERLIPYNSTDSPLRDAREDYPYELFLFLLNLLQGMVIEFLKAAATTEEYVKFCETTMKKCPPSIIGLMIYFQTPNLPAVFLATCKTKAEEEEEFSPRAVEAEWVKFDKNVMQHLIWPAVAAGKITVAPSATRDKPEWWNDMLPILEDAKVYGMFHKGGKKRARACWHHICDELHRHVFDGLARQVWNYISKPQSTSYAQPTVDEFLVAGGYKVAKAAVDKVSASRRASQPLQETYVQDEIVRRYVYSQVDELAQASLEELEFGPTSNEDCECIRKAFEEYQKEGKLQPAKLNLSAVVMEVRLCKDEFTRKHMFPSLTHTACLPDDEYPYADPGDEVWELMATLTKISPMVKSSRFNRNPIESFSIFLHKEIQKQHPESSRKRKIDAFEKKLCRCGADRAACGACGQGWAQRMNHKP
jgi:hypothetical protein